MEDTADGRSGIGDMLALGSAVLFAIIGLILAVAGVDGGMRLHGLIFCAASAAACVYILSHPTDLRKEKASGYFDGPVRVATIACVFWGIVGFLVGDVLAWQLAFPALNFDLPWTQFRPAEAGAYVCRRFCIRRQCADRNVSLCRPEDLPRTASR